MYSECDSLTLRHEIFLDKWTCYYNQSIYKKVKIDLEVIAMKAYFTLPRASPADEILSLTHDNPITGLSSNPE